MSERRSEWRLDLGCEWCLDQSNHQGWYGESFVQVLAAAAGLQCSPLTPDCTGVDLDISGTREVRGDFPCVKVQVKSWIGGAQPRSETSGLNGLRDRIGALNGTMDIISPPTGGTVLQACIPLSSSSQREGA